MKRLLLALAGALGGSSAAGAQTPVELPRLAGPVSLDGLPDEAVWQEIPALPVVVYEPTYRKAPSQRTEIKLAYDDRYLYLAARLYDTQPQEVRAGSLYRDRYGGDDTVGLVVDSFDDDQNARWFYTTPAGLRADASVADDMESGQPDWSWNGHWDAAAAETGDGWSAEIRIPFTTLGFSEQDGGAVMGLAVYRWLSRYNERQIWPDVPPHWARAYAKPSRLQDARVERVSRDVGLYLTPYLLAGARRGPVTSATDDSGPFVVRSAVAREAGLDFRYGLSNAITLDLTLNTDFAQVEADDQRINLTRFPLFFPEKRQFFLERAGIFDVAFSGRDRLFHSRRIGLHEGEPIRIWGGGRVVGRAGKWDLGFLEMQTASSAALPSENFGVLRLRRQVVNRVSTLGAILTSRVGDDGRHNVVYGADADVGVFADHFLTVKAAQSRAEALTPEGRSRSVGERVLASWQRRRAEGLSYAFTADRSAEGFEPGLGFSERRGFSFAGQELGYQWLLPAGWLLRRIWIGDVAGVHRRHADDRVESGSAQPFLRLETPAGDDLEIASSHAYEDVLEPFKVAEVLTVPAGRYRFHRARAAIATSDSRRLRVGLEAEGGGFYDGQSLTAATSLTWNASRHFELGGEYERHRIRFPSRAEAADTDLFRARAHLAWDVHASLSAFVQWSDVQRAFSVNLRARFHFREGSDLWLVYDEGRMRSSRSPAQAMPDPHERAFLLKYTYTFVR